MDRGKVTGALTGRALQARQLSDGTGARSAKRSQRYWAGAAFFERSWERL
jgi:hypothetical protein